MGKAIPRPIDAPLVLCHFFCRNLPFIAGKGMRSLEIRHPMNAVWKPA